MVKRILIYLFSSSIIIQSMLGQFLLMDPSTGSFVILPSISSLSSKDINNSQSRLSSKEHHAPMGMSTQERNGEKQDADYADSSCITRDLVVEHLFSPSNCPTEMSHQLVAFSNMYLGGSSNLFTIQEKINDCLAFYSDVFRFIQIGLPIQKIIYPFHNFY